MERLYSGEMNKMPSEASTACSSARPSEEAGHKNESHGGNDHEDSHQDSSQERGGWGGGSVSGRAFRPTASIAFFDGF
jgi:hypothetical protein